MTLVLWEKGRLEIWYLSEDGEMFAALRMYEFDRPTARKMRSLGARPESIHAAMGAAIGRCCFETDDDVPQAIERYLGGGAEGLFDRRPDGKTMVDLRAANARRLVQLGLDAGNIDVSAECTVCSHDKYWSHRYTKGRRGSQAAAIVLE